VPPAEVVSKIFLCIWRQQSCPHFPPSSVFQAPLRPANVSQMCEESNFERTYKLWRENCCEQPVSCVVFVFGCFCLLFLLLLRFCCFCFLVLGVWKQYPNQSHLTPSIWPGQPTIHIVLHSPRLAGTLVRGRNGAKPCGVNLGRFSSVTSFIIYIYPCTTSILWL